ncbi:acyl-CoA dehydrogenase family protein [Pseudomonas paraeruginosa]|nr:MULTISPECIES: acyl-CoA dehydrogenase family protein [Pseudomonas aeruginosa group]AVR69089.1 acyl-CoA dehydrogenase [Pseudomonas paraeruginosa]MBG3903214.1 acyl-CoA dehydrogenase family protein [Pseudomonas aeruginosa]MBG4201630.1 acyl-CoA dehydrogenase family protein [Pseudomonas aeruginosa]MBG4277545.1 acyl-CoA dehydrogenase family protein [Pseudomonas aeruginosa]MBG6892802.1 acyl-CoA dehydrogenase family protein [Pseudomonas aeruginosa]
MACAGPAVTLRPAGERTPSYPQEYEQMSEQDDWDREREERLRMIRDSAASLVPRDGDLTRVRRGRFSGTAVDRQAWREVCAMGWPGLRLDQALGGSGLGMAEWVALLETLGRGLLPEPLIEVGLVAPLLPEEQRAALLAGERLILPAGIGYREERQRPCLDGGRLRGGVARVCLGGAADAWLVACAQGLALVERDAAGVELVCEPTQDGAHRARLRFHDTPARPLPVDGPVEQALDEAALACAAYLVGLMDGAFERTLEYLRVRRQFGREIGSFQALQHRMVDLKIQIELSRAMVGQAAAAIDAGASANERRRQVSSARVRGSEAALLVTRQAIQLHGGIGYTDEADIGLFLRRAMVLLNAHGSLDFHRARYVESLQREVA